MLDLYEFKPYLFDNGDRENICSFVRNFNMTTVASETLEIRVKVQYLCTIFLEKSLRQYDLLDDDL